MKLFAVFLTFVMIKKFPNIFQFELVEPAYFGIFSVSRGNYHKSFILTFSFHKEPGFMYTIHATPICIVSENANLNLVKLILTEDIRIFRCHEVFLLDILT